MGEVVTLADEDTNSIQTDNANRAIQGNALCSHREQLGVGKIFKSSCLAFAHFWSKSDIK